MSTRLGDRLLSAGVIGADQLNVALTEQRRRHRSLGRILVELGFVSEAVLREWLGEVMQYESVDLAATVPDPAALERIPRAFARRHRIVPVSYRDEVPSIDVAMADPGDLPVLDRLRTYLTDGVAVRPLLASEGEIEEAIDRFYGHALSVDGILHEFETGEPRHTLREEAGGYSPPLVRLVDAVLADAVHQEASDIHLEPENGFVRIRYRIDGVLQSVRSVHDSFRSPITVRIKVMAGMNIAETRLPQDGRITRSIRGREIDFRVSAVPVTHGENLVLRVLDRRRGLFDLNGLGLDTETLAALRLMLSRPDGLLLVTGPTGSGKTTTLHSILRERNDESVNIVTLEDPVEYPQPLIRQSAINEAVGFDFAGGVRSLMRQDPDIMLIGEIRDRETAALALRAAMTGHQVYATLHAHAAPVAIPRLLDLGLSPEVLAGNLIGVVGQRLVRRLCPDCCLSDAPTREERRLLRIADDEEVAIRRPGGCPKCTNRGYRGRIMLCELLPVDAELDERIARRAGVGEIRGAARARGFRDLAADAVRRVRNGETSIAEVMRAVDLTREPVPEAT